MLRRPVAALWLIASFPAVAQTVETPAPDTSERVITAPALPGAPRAARTSANAGTSRNAPINGVLTLYGNERCPTNQDGAEVVVCVRRGAEEQFRIPKELRNFEVTPENESWAAREKANSDVGNTGIGSCTTVGPGGGTGCFVQNARRSKKDVQAREKAATPDLDPY
jgi:hypothetical protein